MSGTHFSGPIKLGKNSMPLNDDVDGISAAVTLTADESNGMNYILDGGTGKAITLPPVTQGWSCRFTVGAAFATSNFVFTAGTADSLEGAHMVAGAVVGVDAADSVTLDASKENVGDFVDFWSDGTSTFTYGEFLTTAAATSTG